MPARRTTVRIDDTLLREAQEALGTKGLQDTVETSLREAVRRRKLKEFSDALGTFRVDLTLEELLRGRADES